ncbi:MAG: SET domain-containing protein [Pseudorhodoplanes sp.]
MPARSFRVGRSKTGLGLFATREIPKGEIIVYYKGRIIPDKLARELENDTSNRYLYEINSRWTIDGSSRRNLGRYANHSCRPNAESDIRKHKVFIRATKKIAPGDEITYDYGRDYFNAFLKPIGCLCDKCVEKRRAERAQKRKNAIAAKKRAATRARNLRAKARSKTRTKPRTAKKAGQGKKPRR